jgi:O-antigen/teichoic acid export membrane protein
MRRSLACIATEISGSMGVTMITMLLMARLMTPEQFGTSALVLGGVTTRLESMSQPLNLD